MPTEATAPAIARSVDVPAMVRLIARQRGYRLKDLPPIVGVSQPQVSERLNGKLSFRADELERLASAFGCHPGDFFQDPAEVLRRGSGWWAARGSNPAPEDYESRRHLTVLDGGSSKAGVTKARRPLVAVVKA